MRKKTTRGAMSVLPGCTFADTARHHRYLPRSFTNESAASTIHSTNSAMVNPLPPANSSHLDSVYEYGSPPQVVQHDGQIKQQQPDCRGVAARLAHYSLDHPEPRLDYPPSAVLWYFRHDGLRFSQTCWWQRPEVLVRCVGVFCSVLGLPRVLRIIGHARRRRPGRR